jgi:hypothetical protein
MKQPLLGSVELAEKRNHVGVIEPVISEPMPNMNPVFLLGMCVVFIFVIGYASGLNCTGCI